MLPEVDVDKNRSRKKIWGLPDAGTGVVISLTTIRATLKCLSVARFNCC